MPPSDTYTRLVPTDAVSGCLVYIGINDGKENKLNIRKSDVVLFFFYCLILFGRCEADKKKWMINNM